MDTYLKLASVKDNKNCNCISPFYLNNISGINPNTGREYSTEDINILKTSLYRISNAKGCNVATCCDINDPTLNPDSKFTKQFIEKFPKIMPIYEGSELKSIKLSTSADVKESGWQDPTPYMICKITKATITDTKDTHIKLATNLVNDCYTNNCNAGDQITIDTLLQNTKADMTYTYFDDARVVQSILEGNISFVKEYIRKYKKVDIPLTNDDYNNRMIHLAAQSKNPEILTMLIALKANLNIQNKFRETPIHFAIRSKNLDNINALLTQGVDLTLANNNGETPMFYAMATGDIRIINMLYQNNSPLQGLDNNGNNLIHYCILNCPSDSTVPNTKSEIIQFLIDRGISTEQKNKAGITPLEMTSNLINNEVNKENKNNATVEQGIILEKFFNKKDVSNQNIIDYTPEHISLLDIQTKLFNNILRNNPNKYSDYINVDDIPRGAPIEILDTVCVGGNGITGNEDSDECIAKGGRISKIVNKTTKIKLELTPDEDSQIESISQNDLYFPKYNKKIPSGTVPISIANYNASVATATNALLSNIPQTTSITYNLGTNSTNAITTTTPPQQTISNFKDVNLALDLDKGEHPNIIDENDMIANKCKRDAEYNASKIEAFMNQPTFFEKNKLYILLLVLILVFIYLIVR